jgi:hypothetical protein
MGFVRGVLLVTFSMIFFFSIIFGGLLYTMSSSLSYSSVQEPAFNFINNAIVEPLNLTSMVNPYLTVIQQYCNNTGNSDYVLYLQGYALHVSCSDANSNNVGLLMNNTIKNLAGDLYYKTYDCGYWDCFSKYMPPLFVISEKSDNYWTNLFYYDLAAAIASAVALFFLFKRKYDLFFLGGGILIFSSLLLLGISKVIVIFPNQIVKGVMSIFFSQAKTVFIKMLLPGIGLILAGLIIEMFRAGFKIYNMFSRVGEEDGEDNKKSDKKNKSQKGKK